MAKKVHRNVKKALDHLTLLWQACTGETRKQLELIGGRAVFLRISCTIWKNLLDYRLQTAGQGHGGEICQNDEAARYQLLLRKFLSSKPLKAGRVLRERTI